MTAPPPDFDVRLVDPDTGGTLGRWTRGCRLRLEPEALHGSADENHPHFGVVRVMTRCRLCGPLVCHGIPYAEINLQPDYHEGPRSLTSEERESSRAAIARAISWCWGTTQADSLTKAGLEPPAGPITSQPPQLSDDLMATGWRVSDLWLLTSVAQAMIPQCVPWCLRGARLLYSDVGALVIWHPIHDAADWLSSAGDRLVIPLPECRRRHSFLSVIEGYTGDAHVARLLQDALQHQDWTLWQLTQRVEAWERLFFQTAGVGTFFEGFAPESLAPTLDAIHNLLSTFRAVARDHERRARLSWLPSPRVTSIDPDVIDFSAEVRIRASRIQDRIDALNQSLREGWTLLANAATGSQFELERSNQRFQQRFQNAATIVTALVLVPSIVTSLYSTNLPALPGRRHDSELSALAFVGVYSVLGSLVTYVVLRQLERNRRTKALVALMVGAVLTVAVTVVGIQHVQHPHR